MTADALIAQKRAEIAAKLAAMKSAAPTPKPSTPATKSSHSPSPAPPPVDDLAHRVAEAQRRVAESQSRLAIKENPYMVGRIEYSWFTSLMPPPLLVTPPDREEEQAPRACPAGCGFEDGGTSTTFGYVHPCTTV